MPRYAKFAASLFAAALVLLLSACSATLGGVSPEHLDISGDWVLDKELSQAVIPVKAQQRAANKIGKGAAGKNGSGKPQHGGRDRSADGESSESEPASEASFASQGSGRLGFNQPEAFTAEAMQIEQSSDSMGIAYTSGTYRDVNWGVREKHGVKVTAGWDGNEVEVRTEGVGRGYKERYSLNDKGQLVVKIILGKEEFVRLYNSKE